jgi:tetratricopeptide (TPR) repeat protein
LILTNIGLALAFLSIAQAGITHLTTIDFPGGVADDIRDGRRAFEEGKYDAALGLFRAALNAQPDSAVSAQGAACASWHLGNGDSAVSYLQQAIVAGDNFKYAHNCFGSVTPFQLLRVLNVGPVPVLYRRPIDARARQALDDATVAAPANRPRALMLLACVNERAGLPQLGHLQRLTSAQLAPDEPTRDALAKELAECRR